MDFENFGGKRKSKKSKTPSPKSKNNKIYVAHNMVEKGTIQQRRQEQRYTGMNGTKDIFSQIDLTAEASKRLEEAETAVENQIFAEYQQQVENDIGDYDDDLQAWENESLIGPPMDGITNNYEDIHSSFLNNDGWFMECDVCYGNDAGTAKCQCHSFITPVPFCKWEPLAGSNELVPTTIVVPIEQMVAV